MQNDPTISRHLTRRLLHSSDLLYIDQSFSVTKSTFRFNALFAKRPRDPRASSSIDDDDDMDFNADDDDDAEGEEDGTFWFVHLSFRCLFNISFSLFKCNGMQTMKNCMKRIWK